MLPRLSRVVALHVAFPAWGVDGDGQGDGSDSGAAAELRGRAAVAALHELLILFDNEVHAGPPEIRAFPGDQRWILTCGLIIHAFEFRLVNSLTSAFRCCHFSLF